MILWVAKSANDIEASQIAELSMVQAIVLQYAIEQSCAL
jgi:hypothetical protein